MVKGLAVEQGGKGRSFGRCAALNRDIPVACEKFYAAKNPQPYSRTLSLMSPDPTQDLSKGLGVPRYRARAIYFIEPGGYP